MELSMVFYKHIMLRDIIIKNIIIIFKLPTIIGFVTLHLNPLKILKL